MSRLRECREKLGLSLAAVASKVGLTVPHLSRMERGERPLTEVWMRRLAPVLGVQPFELIAPSQSNAKLVENPEELRWLEIWGRLSKRERRVVLQFIDALTAEDGLRSQDDNVSQRSAS